MQDKSKGILFVGDLHGCKYDMLAAVNYAKNNNCDTIIQVGDFGFVWNHKNIGRGYEGINDVKNKMKRHKDMTFIFIDGNHEDYDRLAAHGCDIHTPGLYRVSADNIFYAARGTLQNIKGLNILFCGGAISVDKMTRKNRINYFEEESITQEDVHNCVQHENTNVDILVLHDAPRTDTLLELFSTYEDRYPIPPVVLIECDINRRKIEHIIDRINPKLTIHGHTHHHYMETWRGHDIIGLHHGDFRVPTNEKYHIILPKVQYMKSNDVLGIEKRQYTISWVDETYLEFMTLLNYKFKFEVQDVIIFKNEVYIFNCFIFTLRNNNELEKLKHVLHNPNSTVIFGDVP